MKGKPVVDLSDSKWLCDLALMMDISKYLSELNVKLVRSLLSHMNPKKTKKVIVCILLLCKNKGLSQL